MDNGRAALYFEDYVLAIQYFNQVINVKPYLADPYFFRGLAKSELDDNLGAIADFNSRRAREDLRGHVITSYSIHYTKLYD